MGRVWLVRHPEHSTPLALKVLSTASGLDQRRREALALEIETLAYLNHPGILTLLDWGEVTDEEAERFEGLIPGSPWLLTECVEGAPFLEGVERFEWPRLRSALVELLGSLAHIHARGWLHCDLSRSNVLWSDRERRPIIVDFGLTAETNTSGRASGTLGFAAPEQLRGGRLGPWTDLFALGRLASMACYGRSTHLKVPSGLASWLGTLCHEDPSLRFQCAAEALHALNQLGGEEESAGEIAAGSGFGQTRTFAPTATIAGDSPSFTPGTPPLPSRSRHPAPPMPESWRPPIEHTPRVRWNRPGASLFELREPKVVGRIDERDELWAALRDSFASEEPVIVRLEGEPGIGITRLLKWLERRVHETAAATSTRSLREFEELEGRRRLLILDAPTADSASRAAALVGSGLVLLGRSPVKVGRELPISPIHVSHRGDLVRSFLPCSRELCGWLATSCGGNPGATRATLARLQEEGRIEQVAGEMCWAPGERPPYREFGESELEAQLDLIQEHRKAGRVDIFSHLLRELEASPATRGAALTSTTAYRLWRLNADLAVGIPDPELGRRVLEEGERLQEAWRGRLELRTIMSRRIMVQRMLGLHGDSVELAKHLVQLHAGEAYEARACYELGYSLLLDGRFGESTEVFQRSVEVSETLSSNILPHALEGLAVAAGCAMEVDAGMAASDRAIAIRLEQGQEVLCSTIHDNRSSILLYAGRPAEAREEALRAISLSERAGVMSPLSPLIHLIAAEHQLENRLQVELLIDELRRVNTGRDGRLDGPIEIFLLFHAIEDGEWDRWDEGWARCERAQSACPDWHPSHGYYLSRLVESLEGRAQSERAALVREALTRFGEQIGWEILEPWGVSHPSLKS